MANLKTFLVALMLILFSAFAPDAAASCTGDRQGASNGDIASAIGNSPRTTRVTVGRYEALRRLRNSHGNVHVELDLNPAWTCYTWEAELVLPACWGVYTGHGYSDVETSAKATGEGPDKVNWHVQRDFRAEAGNACNTGLFAKPEETATGHVKVSIITKTSEGARGPLAGTDSGKPFFLPIEFHSTHH